ncbi:GRF zinc finger protein [Medicago truncatula]|uniref:GRF zinc finger protein n=2 Tax=Medicago truncatula TaxID=3880 RepID=G7L065_MEDTR|nr:GRF zinc finger protein [Medicago truncatula]
MECKCGDFPIIRTVNDTSNPNCGKKFWSCNNYRNSFEKGCGFFKLIEDEEFCTESKDEGLELKLKSEKTKRKNKKLTMDLAKTKNWLKLSLAFGFASFGTCLVLGTIILCK